MGKAKIIRIRPRKRPLRLIAVLAIAAAAIGLSVYLNSEAFGVNTITVTGITDPTTASIEEVLNAAGLKKGMNIFSFSASKAREAIMDKLPSIDSAYVGRKLPNTLEVAVHQRVAETCLYYGNKYYLIDRDGFVFNDTAKQAPEGAIKANGLSDLALAVGTSFDYSQSSQAKTLKGILDYMRQSGLSSKIKEFAVTSSGLYTITTSNENYIQFYSLNDFQDKKDLLEKYILSETRPGIIAVAVAGSDLVYKALSEPQK